MCVYGENRVVSKMSRREISVLPVSLTNYPSELYKITSSDVVIRRGLTFNMLLNSIAKTKIFVGNYFIIFCIDGIYQKIPVH